MPKILLAAMFVLLNAVTVTVRADEPLILQYKAAKGDKSIYRTMTESKQSQSFGDVKFDATTSQEEITSRVVDDVDADKLRLKIKNERLKSKMALGPAGTFEFDSRSTENEKGSAIAAMLLPFMERVSGAEYEIAITPRGEVAEVKGYAELFTDLLKENPILGQFAGGGTNESAKITMQEGFVIFGEKPVVPGDTWEVPFETEIPSIGKIKGKLVYRYDGLEKVGDKSAAKVSVTTELSVDIKVDFNGVTGMGTMTATDSSGTILFDIAAGQLLSFKKSITLVGQISINVNNMNIAIQTEQTQTISKQLLDKLPE